MPYMLSPASISRLRAHGGSPQALRPPPQEHHGHGGLDILEDRGPAPRQCGLAFPDRITNEMPS
ncbi:hypothetical protein GH733_009490 [Mirounga leonina]|nr:hypothetical protein GH733_009490 [Mirounga leonina]